MPSSDGFGSGIFDDEIEEVNEEPQEKTKTEKPAQRREPWEEEEGEGEIPPPPPPPKKRPAPRPEPAAEEAEEPRRRPPKPRSEEGKGRGRRRRPRKGEGEERSSRGPGPRPRQTGENITPSGVATGAGEIPAGALVHQRVALLVDADLLDQEAEEVHEAKVSYRKVFAHAVQGRSAVRAIAYTSEEEKDSRGPFHDHLTTSGFELVLRVGSGSGRWDVRITLDALSLADKVDAIVVASDRDTLLPLMEYLRGRGVKVEVASFLTLDENPLAQACQAYVPLDKKALYTP